MHDVRVAIALSGLLFGCSVINSYGDVVQGNATGGTGATSGNGGGAATGGTSSGGAAGNGGNGSGNAGSGGSASVQHPTPTKGLVVIGATTPDGTEGLLSVIDPKTGSELDRETLPSGADVASLGYDGEAGRDVWYVFISADFPSKPDKNADLEVRYFDDTTNSWSTVSKLTTLPSPRPQTVAVLNKRLAYLSYETVNGTPGTPWLTLLDTTDLQSIQKIPIDSLNLPAGAEMLGLLGARGAIGDPGGVGGQLTVVFSSNCNASSGVCDLNVLPITVGDNISQGAAKLIGQYTGQPAFASTQIKQRNYYAMPAIPSASSQRVQIADTDPRAPESPTTNDAPTSATDVGGMAIAECQNVELLTSFEDSQIVPVALATGIGTPQALGWPGQLVQWDPFTAYAIATYNPTGGILAAGIKAFSVVTNGTGTTASLQEVTPWDAPTDFYTDVVAVRFPVPFTCP